MTPQFTTAIKAALRHTWLRKLGLVILLSLPVLLYSWHYTLGNLHGNFQPADSDELAQMYEAARLSIVHYHQFPWWNSWSAGGEPLFANPQFGLFSIPMPFVLLFGTIVGLHIGILVYFLLGFWGMYLLLQRLGSNSQVISILLAYIWTFSGFSTLHIVGGQLTFAVYLLAPWVFLTLLNIGRRHGWLWFGLSVSLIVNSAAHYITIEILLICLPLLAIKLYRLLRPAWPLKLKPTLLLLRPYLYAFGLIVVLCGAKLFYTLQFLHEYPRPEPLDPPTSISLLITALTSRHTLDPQTMFHTPYGWVEYGDYLGLLTLALFAYLVIRKLEMIKRVKYTEWLLLACILLAATITAGSFAGWSPFSILHKLPVFNQMRVPSRFICWLVFGIILFLAKLPRKPVIYAILAFSVLDVFNAGYLVLNAQPQKPYLAPSTHSKQSFQQYEFYDADPKLGQIGILNLGNMRLLRATQDNYGEIYAYDPVLNLGEYYYLPGTKRCGINKGCPFVLSKNAVVTHWSPLKIVLKRTAKGAIDLNMNPGKVWQINGRTPFATYKVLELRKDFVITDPSATITIQYKPGI